MIQFIAINSVGNKRIKTADLYYTVRRRKKVELPHLYPVKCKEKGWDMEDSTLDQTTAPGVSGDVRAVHFCSVSFMWKGSTDAVMVHSFYCVFSSGNKYTAAKLWMSL